MAGINDSEVTERHRQRATALTVIMALHRHPFDPRTPYRHRLA